MQLKSAFSLLEVVLAVGVFTVGILAVLAFMPGMVRSAANDRVILVATQLPVAIRTELERMAGGSVSDLAGQCAVLGGGFPATLQLAGSRGGDRVASISYRIPVLPDRIPENEQFFLIEAWRFGGEPPLAYASGAAALPLHVRISWPYRETGTGIMVNESERESVSFNLVITP